MDKYKLNEPKCNELRISFCTKPASFQLKKSRTDPVLQDLHSTNYRVRLPGVNSATAYSLPAYLSKGIEMVQRRAMRIISPSFPLSSLPLPSLPLPSLPFPSLTYKEASDEAGLISLYDRHQLLTDRLFNKVTPDRENRLHNLLPAAITNHYKLSKQRQFLPSFNLPDH